MQTFDKRIQNFSQRGSNWRYQRVKSLDINPAEYRSLNGSSYIKLPIYPKEESSINIKKKDNQCFKQCIARALNPLKSHPDRISDLRGKTSQLNFTGIEFPVKLRDIDRFDKQNEGIAVDVFGLKGTKFYPLRISEKKNREQEGKLIIDLLMIKEEGNQHYCLIKIS